MSEDSKKKLKNLKTLSKVSFSSNSSTSTKSGIKVKKVDLKKENKKFNSEQKLLNSVSQNSIETKCERDSG